VRAWFQECSLCSLSDGSEIDWLARRCADSVFRFITCPVRTCHDRVAAPPARPSPQRPPDAAALRQVDHRAVIAWERAMRETEHAAASTIRRRLAALSSLFKHLVRNGHAARNPVADVLRPTIT
jgi:hypothetical protein